MQLVCACKSCQTFYFILSCWGKNFFFYAYQHLNVGRNVEQMVFFRENTCSVISIAVWSVCQKMYYYADTKRTNIPNSLLHVFILDCLVTPQPISDFPGLVDTGRGPTGAFTRGHRAGNKLPAGVF